MCECPFVASSCCFSVMNVFSGQFSLQWGLLAIVSKQLTLLRTELRGGHYVVALGAMCQCSWTAYYLFQKSTRNVFESQYPLVRPYCSHRVIDGCGFSCSFLISIQSVQKWQTWKIKFATTYCGDRLYMFFHLLLSKCYII